MSKDIYDYSNPSIVQENARNYLGKNAKVFFSTRKDKKYMMKDPEGKWVHFGQYGFQDYTLHQDEERRRKFRNRNAKWKDAERWSPAWLSWHLLW